MLKKDKQVGEYVLIERLGTGGFGEVWKAEKRTALSVSQFAIKFFRAKDDDEIDTETVKKEVHTWQTLSGLPHVLSVIEGNTFEDYVYIVSEYADGGSLERWLIANGGKANSYNEAVAITSQILQGLDSMHSEGFVHRDLKPANVLLKRNVLYLADFGISRQMKTHSKSTGTAGTYEYMPPEAFEAKPVVTPQTDIWATGVILQKLLTGELPFPQDEIPSLMAAIIMREPAPINEQVPESLRAIVRKALQKSPEQRFQTAGEMLQALHNPQAFLEGNLPSHESARYETFKTNNRQSIETSAKLPIPSQQTGSLSQSTGQSQQTVTAVNLPGNSVATQETSSAAALVDTPPARRSKNYFIFIIPVVLVGLVLVSLASIALWKVIGNPAGNNSNQAANNDPGADIIKKMSDVDYYNLGNECIGKKDYDCAIKNFTEAITMTPNYPEAFEGRGTAYSSRGDYNRDQDKPEQAKKDFDAAVNDFTKALDLKADSETAYYGRGVAYNKRDFFEETPKHFDDAIKDLSRALKLKPEYIEAYIGRGNAYRSNGEPDRAIQDYNKVTELNSYYVQAYVERADAYGRSSKFQQGITEISKAIDLDPSSSENYRLRGHFKEMLNKNTEAIADYRKALELDPNNKDARLNLDTILDK